MKKLRILTLTALLALCLCACGSKEAAAPETTAAPTAAAESTPPAPLTLTDRAISSSTWSSPNGATVHVLAAPSRFQDGQQAAFVVRLEGEETAKIPCEWNGSHYTASADLNAANGYCYYLVVTDTDGSVTEFPINTPTTPLDEALINMEDSLRSYCTVTVDESHTDSSRLTISAGAIQVQAPKLSNNGQPITCLDVLLTLSHDGEQIAQKSLVMQGTNDIGSYTLELSDVVFDLPRLEGAQQLSLDLEVRLSNGQILTAPGGIWYYTDAGLQPAVG